MFTHLLERTDIAAYGEYGYVGVTIFFVLSGYVIAMVIGDNRISLSYLGRFAARRSLRLDPPYWVSIAVAITLMVIAQHLGIEKTLPDTKDVLLHMFYLQDLIGIKPIAAIYWTLCLEIQFYLALILILWTGKPIRIVLVLVVWSVLEQARILEIAPKGLFIPYWFVFSTGVMTYWVNTERLQPAVLYAALIVIAAFSFGIHGPWFAVTAITAVAIHAASVLNRMENWLSTPIWQFFGRISYSLYLFHGLIGWTAQSFTLRYIDQWTALIVGITVSILSAWIAYWLLERPAITLSHLIKVK
jgi:peptidoglycan/LPS O-acetylase OafA/YrhL